MSLKTIETHRMDIKHRLGIHDVPGLVRYAIRAGLMTSDSVSASVSKSRRSYGLPSAIVAGLSQGSPDSTRLLC